MNDLKPKGNQIVELLKFTPFDEVAKIADNLTKHIHGNKVLLRGIIEFSNYCKNNCFFCGIRRQNTKLKRYRMTEKEIINTAYEAAKKGYKTVILQSGEDAFWSAEKLSRIIKEIKKFNVAVTLSVGELSYEDYAILKEAGTDRYLLKFETSDERLFKYLKSDTTLSKRIQCIKWLKELGYETGSGIIVGLPGQTLDSIAKDIVLMEKLSLDMVGIGPFIPHPDTPLGNYLLGDLILTLKVLAITRIVLPHANIPATTALGTISNELRLKAFDVGANVLMLDITPEKYKNFYEIYPGKTKNNSSIDYWKRILKELDRTLF